MVKTLRKKDDIGFTTMMKPLNSFTCNQTKKGNRRPMRLLNKPPGPTISLLLILCSDQIQRIEALITNLYLVHILKCAHNFFYNFVAILTVMFLLTNLSKAGITWQQAHLLASCSFVILKQSKSISCELLLDCPCCLQLYLEEGSVRKVNCFLYCHAYRQMPISSISLRQVWCPCPP